MICKECNSKISNYSKYCPRCGKLIESNDVSYYSKFFDVDYFNIYFPDNCVKYNVNGISVFYLLFNFAYAFYKKMWIEGLVSIFSLILMFNSFGLFDRIFNSLGFTFFLEVSICLIGIFIYLYYAFKFNDLYISSVKHRIGKFIKESKSEEEIIAKCEKDKRGNFVFAIVSVIIFILFLIFL